MIVLVIVPVIIAGDATCYFLEKWEREMVSRFVYRFMLGSELILELLWEFH